VGAGGQDVLLCHQLDEVRERLVPWGTDPALEARDDASIDPLDDEGAQEEKADPRENQQAE
jgi:hypothetical protein